MIVQGPAVPYAGAQDVRVLAFYRLPVAQSPALAPIAGEDLPEWRIVRAARPVFVGHEQPLHPGELGYCDVRTPAVRDAQATLAASYAISGFCYVFRSTGATTVLDPTLVDIAASGRPDFPFCVCWETTALNAGAGFGAEDPSRQRHYSREECLGLMRSLTGVFADPRYVRIGDRPLFLVSSPDPIPEVQLVASLWRAECRRAGAGNPWIACFGGASGAGAAMLGFDAIVECPPLDGFPRSRRDELVLRDAAFAGDVRSYRSYMAQALASSRPDHIVFRTVMTGWDDTAASPAAPKIFVDGNAETFGYWTERALDQTRLRLAGEERLLFIRSWNEWSAGCHVEPDARHGRRYLEALRAAVQRPPSESPRRPSWESMRAWANGGLAAARVVRSKAAQRTGAAAPSVSVVIPAYNHERYVVAALDSVLAQTYGDLEIVAVDDGSHDATGALLDDYASRCRSHALTVVHQPNAGAHEAINHGIALARGELIAILNSDDRYVPMRLERLLAAMDHRQSAFAFSRVRYIDDDGREIAETDPYVRHVRRAVADGLRAPDWVFTLVYSNIAVSTGNFVFRRQLLQRTGGFCAMRVCHDWDFLLAASFETPLAFVDEPLYEYRLHGSNTVASARVSSPIEVEQMLVGFFAHIGEHPVARDPALLETFFAHVRRLGLGGYLPGDLAEMSYQIRYDYGVPARPPEGWVVLDDFFPNLMTGFRIAEYNALMERFPHLSVHSTTSKFERHHRRYARLYPELAPRVRQFLRGALRQPSFAYLNFINNAYEFLRFLDNRKTPFVFTLYPGGGFGIGARECDDKLDRVCASPWLKHVIVTQKLTAEYLRARHPDVPATLIFGCVVNPLYFPATVPPRSWFGHGKASFDLCFVAGKYSPHGLSKGYPVFIDAGRRIAAAMPEARLHVVGDFGPNDWPLGELADRISFHRMLATQQLQEFYTGMDVIVSPNTPFVLHAGHFDGFPTAACAEASLCGVVMLASDVVGLNSGHYEDGNELIIAAPEVEAFTEALLALARDPDRLRSLALAGQQKSRSLYAPGLQIGSRIAVIERETQACGASP